MISEAMKELAAKINDECMKVERGCGNEYNWLDEEMVAELVKQAIDEATAEIKAENERLKEENEKWKAFEREKYKGWAGKIKDNQ